MTVESTPDPGGTTDLTLERNYLAAERTLMGWIRTAISMISFGFSIGKLGEILDDVQINGVLRLRTWSVEGVARTLVILGTGGVALACVQHARRLRALYAMGLRHQVSVTLFIAVLLSLMGAFAFIALVMAL